MLNPGDVSFLRRRAKTYYFERFSAIEIPKDMKMREFAYMRPGGGMVRHIGVTNPADLRVLLMGEGPLDVYVSNARYLVPTLPMDQKAWQDADLIFDIDAKDVGLDCRPSHTVSDCPECGITTGNCGHSAAAVATLPCRKCVRAAGAETDELVRLLSDDFGLAEPRVHFSGNDGFHVQAGGGELAKLGRAERSRIADYVSFRNAKPESLGWGDGKRLPRRTAPGWRGRFMRRAGKKLAGRCSDAMESGYDALAGVLSGAAPFVGIPVDSGVTMDVHRVFRMPGTLNGKSFMAKCSAKTSLFDYGCALAAGSDGVKIVSRCPVKFNLGGSFGPYDGEAEVPAYVAAYLVCKGLAHVT